jgi:hypothetical protein
MSKLALVKRTTLEVPATVDDGFIQLDNVKDAACWVDDTGAVWYMGKQRKALTADLGGFTSTTLADVTGLFFTLLANKAYGFRFKLLFTSAATTTGLKTSVTWPASPTVATASAKIPFAADGSAAWWFGTITTSGDAVTATGVEAATTVYEAIVEGTIVNGVNAGSLQLQAATEVAASAITPKNGSSGECWLL